uniref:Ribonuclease H-like domain-containing protein n=1 Tax=Tanacetum cinerariifolium TaxID=118510 RepID=A0A6L2MHU1_TANCI|nr:ribonuclease H-like domain-containing protein [Tanacetum cinerariifolium]
MVINKIMHTEVIHCLTCYEVSKYIHGSTDASTASNPTPLTTKELKVDKIVLSRIFTTLSEPLQARLVVERPKSTKEAWDLIFDIVDDNKWSRTNALKVEFQSIKFGDLTMESYFRKIESIVTILTSLDSHINDEDVVHYALDGLPDTYNQSLFLPVDSSSAYPMVLMADSGISRRPSNEQVKSWRPCHNFAKGVCRFGNSCKFMHDVNAKPSVTRNNETKGNNTDELLVKLLGRLGLSTDMDTTSKNGTTSKSIVTSLDKPVVYHTTTSSQYYPPSVPSVSPVSHIGPPLGFGYPTTHLPSQITYYSPLAQQGLVAPLVHNTGPAHTLTMYPIVNQAQYYPPARQYSMAQQHPIGSVQPFTTPAPTGSTGQDTTLPHAFVIETLHDPTTGAWTMDKDFMTRRVLLQCDSTKDLYPVTSPSSIPQALVFSHQTWHQRLGHPGSEVLRRLVSSDFISCNKEKPHVLCHAC